MSKKEIKWEEKAKRFVAFLDIMGFKDMMMKTSHEYVLDKVTITKRLKELLIDGTKEGLEMTTNLRSFQFSDSTFIFSASDTAQDFSNLLHQCRILLRFCFEYKIPIKGAISHGVITADFKNSIFVGQPIIDAYLLHEELHMFGAILDHNAENKLNEFILIKRFKEVIEFEAIQYKTPTKNGRIYHYCIKWPFLSFPTPNSESHYALDLKDRETIKKFYTTVSGKPRMYVDNTIEFVDFLIGVEKEKHPNIKEFPFHLIHDKNK